MIDLLQNHPFFNDKIIESCELLENQGYCNENYLLVADGVKYVVRSFNKNDSNREEEYNIQKQAHLAGIAPQPFVLNLQDGYMIMEYIEGKHEKNPDLFLLYTLVDAVGVLHDSVFIDKEMVKARNLVKTRNKDIVEALEIIEDHVEECVVCHNDLNSMNILWYENKPILIDFEYASANDCYFDLAALSIEFNLEKDVESLMLRRYFGGGYYYREKFEAYKIIYTQLCKEWFENM